MLKNKSALITGGASGLGLGCVERFARDGCRVMIADIQEDSGEAVAARLREQGLDVSFVKCDVGVKSDVDNAVQKTIECLGDIQVLISNAGINRPANFLELDEKTFDQVIQTNLKSVFLFGQAVARHMVVKGIRGAIVNMSSTSAVMSMPPLAAYAASKGGISSLTNVMALSLASNGIRVNAIGPGTILTDMTRGRLYDNIDQRNIILSRTPLGRLGDPGDVAGVAAFLADEDYSAFVTGQTIYVEGGRRGLNYTVPVAQS